MSSASGNIFLSDLIQAYAVIGAADPESLATIAEVLRFHVPLNPQTPVAPPDASGPRSAQAPVSEDSDESDTTVSDAPSGSDSSPPEAELVLPEEVQTGAQLSLLEFDLEHNPSESTLPLRLEASWAEWELQDVADPAHQPLFYPQWTRGILSELLATARDTHRLDVQAAVKTIARGRPLLGLPTMKSPTLARGSQVLVDMGPGMMPFRHDLEALLEAIRAVVGSDLVEALFFEDSPTIGVVAEGAVELTAYVPPSFGTSIVILGNLGIVKPLFSLDYTPADDWYTFLAGLQDNQYHIVVLTPYPSHRWPQRLREHFLIVQWDRTTTAASVRRVRRGS